MFCLLKANCQYIQLISNGGLYHRVTTENKENLPAIIAGKANHPTTLIAAFNKRRAIFAGDDHRRQTVTLIGLLLMKDTVCLKAPHFFHLITLCSSDAHVSASIPYTNCYYYESFEVFLIILH